MGLVRPLEYRTSSQLYTKLLYQPIYQKHATSKSLKSNGNNIGSQTTGSSVVEKLIDSGLITDLTVWSLALFSGHERLCYGIVWNLKKNPNKHISHYGHVTIVCGEMSRYSIYGYLLRQPKKLQSKMVLCRTDKLITGRLQYCCSFFPVTKVIKNSRKLNQWIVIYVITLINLSEIKNLFPNKVYYRPKFSYILNYYNVKNVENVY